MLNSSIRDIYADDESFGAVLEDSAIIGSSISNVTSTLGGAHAIFITEQLALICTTELDVACVGFGNSSLDPGLIGSHLQADSPLVDAGIDPKIVGETDGSVLNEMILTDFEVSLPYPHTTSTAPHMDMAAYGISESTSTRPDSAGSRYSRESRGRAFGGSYSPVCDSRARGGSVAGRGVAVGRSELVPGSKPAETACVTGQYWEA